MRLARNAARLPWSAVLLIAAVGPSSCVSAKKPVLIGADAGVGGSAGSAGQTLAPTAGSSGAPATGGSAGVPGTGGAIEPGVGGAPVGCGPDEFQCGSGECIPLSQVCDGLSSNCADGSDETPAACSGSGGTGGSGGPCTEFLCGSGECVPMASVCDGLSAQCADGSDEDPALCSATGTGGSGGTGQGGTGGAQVVCEAGTFACSNGECIPMALVCDQTEHCPDAEDETPAACAAANTGGTTGSGGTGAGGTGTGGVVGTGGDGMGGTAGAGVGGDVGTGGVGTGGNGGVAGSAGAGTGGDQGYTPCEPTLDASSGQSGNLGTDEVCAELCNHTFMRLYVNNFGTAGAPRTLVANGVPVDCPVTGECNWTAAAPPRIDGCYYFEISAGEPEFASFNTAQG